MATGDKSSMTKSYFDVLGLCCSSEVPLVEKILHSLDGVVSVAVIVPSRTVIVVHDSTLISQLQIVKKLNQARLEASARPQYGSSAGGGHVRRWPSPYTVACGVLLAASFLKSVYHPLRWLAVAAVVVGLPPILLRAAAAVRRLTLDINILILIAVGVSMALEDYWEAGSIVFLFTVAEWLESTASYKATSVMSALMSMAPQKAVLADTGEAVEANSVAVGTVLAVKAGEVVPIDGVVVQGRSEVDESSLTGESFPVPKHPASPVWAGTLNIDGYISVKTTDLAENSAVAKMMKLVEEAQNGKSKTQRIIDSCAKYYTPALVLASALLAIAPLATKAHNAKRWIRLALVLLVSACPCALVLSTPVATFCALATAARAGLLVKGGDFLEALSRTKVVAFDKTGTITTGDFRVMDFNPIITSVTSTAPDVIITESLLYWVSSIESKSSHPMASALVGFARHAYSIEPKPENVGEFRIYPGEGIYGEIDGRSFYVGNQRIGARAGCTAGAVPDDVGKKAKGATVGYVFSGAALVGVFSLSDTCRTGAAEAVRELKRMGITTAMLTGDSRAAAMFSQNQLDHALDMVHAELLPEEKVGIIKDLKLEHGPTAMVGDGMNDAPALSAADVGIAMGISGSAIAMETSHVTLMSNDIRKIPAAIRLGRATGRKIIENIILSVVTKAAILALAFAGHPLLWAAILADVGTCLLVILNSMLLLKTKRSHGNGGCCEAHGHGTKESRPHHYHHLHGRNASTSSGCTDDHVDEANCTSTKCCSHSTGRGCGAPEHPKVETRAVLAAGKTCHEGGSSTSCLAALLVCQGHGRAHADNDHNHHDGHVHNQHCHSHDSHLISMSSGDGDAGYGGTQKSPTQCAAEKSHCGTAQCCSPKEEGKVVHDAKICAHREDEVECLRQIACEKPNSCSASALHSHQVCPEQGKRPATACCRSQCRGCYWPAGGQRSSTTTAYGQCGGGLPQLEIITAE
ncbi:hypothetical protein Taro_021705 [Colocasia esculenta]|uniref:HMA domain-containing protein n=1 Tax=Colocasia esculenta TaxID=4460 RepID=A0A843V911_COLES|nr:hypothetical protein [Colocasia esculenta]